MLLLMPHSYDTFLEVVSSPRSLSKQRSFGLTTVSASHTTHYHNAPIFLVLRRRVGVMPFRCQLAHCRRGILQSEKRRQAVRLEALLQVCRRSGID